MTRAGVSLGRKICLFTKVTGSRELVFLRSSKDLLFARPYTRAVSPSPAVLSTAPSKAGKGKQRVSSSSPAFQYRPLPEGWEAIIGVECHAQLKGDSKLFSPAPLVEGLGALPNSHVAPFDVALPGSLPQPQVGPLRLALGACLALQCNLEKQVGFDRKHYFYPDLTSGYQITQKYAPLARNGKVQLKFDEGHLSHITEEVDVCVEQVQLEQDTAKSMHYHTDSIASSKTFVDLNRAGQALIEIVSGPDMRTPVQAGAYVRKLRELLRRVGASDGNMDEGSLRCDVNVSVHKIGDPWGNRCEVKNINSVRFVMNAVVHEMHRQHQILGRGGMVEQETRTFNEETGETTRLRSKEDSPDYRYMPDPNLPSLSISEAILDPIRISMPELPDQQRKRLVETYRIPMRDINVLLRVGLEDGDSSTGLPMSPVQFYEEVAKNRDPQIAMNWVIQELLKALNHAGISFINNPVESQHLGELIGLVESGKVTASTARSLLSELVQSSPSFDLADTPTPIFSLLQERDLLALGSSQQLEPLCQEVIQSLPNEAEQVRKGNGKVVMRLVGELMKRAKGRADAKLAREVLLKMLDC